MTHRCEWTGLGPFVIIALVAILLTAVQVGLDRSVFDSYFGAFHPVVVMAVVSMLGVVSLAYLRSAAGFEMVGPGSWSDAVVFAAWVVPLLALAAVGADLLLRFPEDTNVAMPHALAFYPSIAVFVEIALHAVPIAILVALFGPPTGVDITFWRIAIPVALIEAGLQTAYATSVGTAVFSGIQLMVFGVVQVWLLWRFGFAPMLGFRLAYYSLWHVAWGVARLELLF